MRLLFDLLEFLQYPIILKTTIAYFFSIVLEMKEENKLHTQIWL